MDSLNEEFGSLVGTENSAEDLATKHATNNEISKFHFTTATLAVLALCCGCLFVGSNYWDKQMWTSSTTDLLSDSVNDPVFQKSSTPPRHNEKWHGIISLAEKSANVCDFSWEKHLPPVIAESMDFLICKVEGKKTICALDRELKKKTGNRSESLQSHWNTMCCHSWFWSGRGRQQQDMRPCCLQRGLKKYCAKHSDDVAETFGFGSSWPWPEETSFSRWMLRHLMLAWNRMPPWWFTCGEVGTTAGIYHS